MKVQSIQQFLFNKAEYIINDGEDSLLLKVDYKNNTFSLEYNNPIKETVKKEVEAIAHDLLGRKHAVNFAEK